MPETNVPIFPPGRYGRRRAPIRHRRLRALMLAILVTGVVVVTSFMAYGLGQQYGPGRPYDASVLRFYDITDEQVVVEFRVILPEGESAICAVRARAFDGSEVGREEVRVDPADGQTRPTVVHRLATNERPVTGEVQRCWRAE
jgi:hypothetical protein